MDVQKYLGRIGYQGDTQPTAENLSRLQCAHLYSVPYENMDILWERPIVLEKEALYTKIVEKRRGGYCFELNSLFNALCKGVTKTNNGHRCPAPCKFNKWLIYTDSGQKYTCTNINNKDSCRGQLCLVN